MLRAGSATWRPLPPRSPTSPTRVTRKSRPSGSAWRRPVTRTNTDAETKSDYLFVTNREKKGLLDLASKVARAGADSAEIKTLGEELSKSIQAAIAPE